MTSIPSLGVKPCRMVTKVMTKKYQYLVEECGGERTAQGYTPHNPAIRCMTRRYEDTSYSVNRSLRNGNLHTDLLANTYGRYQRPGRQRGKQRTIHPDAVNPRSMALTANITVARYRGRL